MTWWPLNRPRPTLGRLGRVLTPLLTAAGAGVLVWLVIDTGPARLASQLRALGPAVPLILGLTGLRYALQAAGWRLALRPEERPPWRGALRGVVAGEAIGYLAWGGPITREPVKTWFLQPHVPPPTALAAAVAERAAYAMAAVTLVVAAVTLVAIRSGQIVWFVVPLLLVTAGAAGLRSRWPRTFGAEPGTTGLPVANSPSRCGWVDTLRRTTGALQTTARELWQDRRAAAASIFALALAQQALLVVEAYLVLGWLGLTPDVATVIVFEGVSKLVNGASGFVPGRVGIYEAGSAVLADALRLGGSYGVSLALARRARALIWAMAGLTLLAHRSLRRSQLTAEPPGQPSALVAIP